MVDLITASLPSAEIQGEVLETRYVPLAIVARYLPSILWEKNPKKGDIGAITQLIQMHGFADKPRWHRSLNDGKGGIQYGNTSTKAIVQLLVELKRRGEKPPKGIPLTTESGEWNGIKWKKGELCIPIEFGMDEEESTSKATIFGLEHNAAVLSGADFGPLDITNRLYEPVELGRLLADLNPSEIEKTPILNGDALDSLLASLKHKEEGTDRIAPEDQDGEPDRGNGQQFFNQFPKAVVLDREGELLWQEACDRFKLSNPTKLVVKLMEECL